MVGRRIRTRGCWRCKCDTTEASSSIIFFVQVVATVAFGLGIDKVRIVFYASFFSFPNPEFRVTFDILYTTISRRVLKVCMTQTASNGCLTLTGRILPRDRHVLKPLGCQGWCTNFCRSRWPRWICESVFWNLGRFLQHILPSAG